MQEWISDIQNLSTMLNHNLMQFILPIVMAYLLAYLFNRTTSLVFPPLLPSYFNHWRILFVLPLFLNCWDNIFLRELFSLSVWLGGLGLFAPTVTAAQQHYQCSQVVNSPLVTLIVSQLHDAISCLLLRSEAHANQRKELQDFTNNIYSKLAPDLHSSVELACEKGASNWLSLFTS